jgi:hypothetical protein
MNPLQLEELLMSSFSSNLIVHKIGSFTSSIQIRSDRFIRSKSHRLKKQIDVGLFHTDRDVPGILSLRYE